MKYCWTHIHSYSLNTTLCSALKPLAHFSCCYKFVSLMGHFVDVFLFKCFNKGRYSIDPKIQLSISFLRDENHTFNVLSEIKWWRVPFISSRKENSLPAELCPRLVSGNIPRVGHGFSWKHQWSSESRLVPSLHWLYDRLYASGSIAYWKVSSYLCWPSKFRSRSWFVPPGTWTIIGK